MIAKVCSRLELAQGQLETAIALFVAGGDRFSVISIAGAADVILSRLVTNANMQNFTDFSISRGESEEERSESRQIYGKKVNDTLYINAMKHFDRGDDEFIEFDPEVCALGAILKALANFVQIASREKDFVKGFLAWVKSNLDPKVYNVDCDPNWKPPLDA